MVCTLHQALGQGPEGGLHLAAGFGSRPGGRFAPYSRLWIKTRRGARLLLDRNSSECEKTLEKILHLEVLT